jgi:hypothetical protein
LQHDSGTEEVEVRRLKFVLAIMTTLLVAACTGGVQTTGSIGVTDSQGRNWIIYVDTLVAGTVAASQSTIIDEVEPGVHAVSGLSSPYSAPQQWVTVSKGQTTWVTF